MFVFLFVYNQSLYHSIRHMPLPIGGSLEESIYLQLVVRYWPLSVVRSRPWLISHVTIWLPVGHFL